MALVYSYAFVFAIIGLSTLLLKLGWLSDEGSRKFIHIGVGNWMIFAALLFDNLLLALIPPLTFVILNYLSYRFDLVKAMERKDKSSSDLGTVYYAISLFVVVLLDYVLFGTWQLSVVPILIMAYGDGLSAVIGQRFPSAKIFQNKTVFGTLTMFIASFVIAVLYLNTWWVIALVAVAATVIELFSPRGFDNLSLPLLVYLVLYLL